LRIEIGKEVLCIPFDQMERNWNHHNQERDSNPFGLLVPSWQNSTIKIFKYFIIIKRNKFNFWGFSSHRFTLFLIINSMIIISNLLLLFMIIKIGTKLSRVIVSEENEEGGCVLNLI